MHVIYTVFFHTIVMMMLKTLILLASTIFFQPGDKPVLERVYLLESDYEVVNVISRDSSVLGAKVRVLNTNIDSLLTSTTYPLSVVFQKEDKYWLTVGFCVISSFMWPQDNWYFLMNQQGRVLKEEDGTITLIAPHQIDQEPLSPEVNAGIRHLYEERWNDRRKNSIPLQSDDFEIVHEESYVVGTGYTIRIINKEKLTSIKTTQSPDISLSLNGVAYLATPRTILQSPEGLWFAIDSTGFPIISDDGMMELTLLPSHPY